MRLKRNYSSAMKRSLDWVFSRFKPLTIHIEAIMIDSVWECVKKTVLRKKVLKWYVMTPSNIDYFKADFNVNLPKKDLSKVMKERYKWMMDHEQKLELHIHLSQVISNMGYKDQKKLFVEAINWMKKELNITPKEFVPGWWSYNEDTLKLCKKFGLKMIYPRDYDFTHDYHWIL